MIKLIKRKQRAFTLVELLVVIAILAVLASASIVGYLTFVDKANLAADNAEIEQINSALRAANSGEDIQVMNSDDLNGAVKNATDGAFDLESYTLRSASKGYSIYYNTELKELEIIKGLPKPAEESGQNSDEEKSKIQKYNTLDGFVWSPETPYLYVQKTGKFGELLSKLNSGEVSLLNFSETTDIAENFDLDNENDRLLLNSFMENQIVLSKSSQDDWQTTGSKWSHNAERSRILVANVVEEIVADNNEELNEPEGIYYLPSNVKTISMGVFSDGVSSYSVNNGRENTSEEIHIHTTNSNFEMKTNTFKSVTDFWFDAKLNDDLVNHIAPQGYDIKIHYENKVYELSAEGKLTSDGETIDENVSDKTSEDVDNWVKEVEDFDSKVKANKYDIYFDVNNDGSGNDVVRLDEDYNKLNSGEKKYIEQKESNAYNLFYGEKDSTTYILSDSTGLYRRHQIYQKVGEYIFEHLGESFDLGNKSEYSLIDEFNGILKESGYGIKFSEKPTVGNAEVDKLYLSNVFDIDIKEGTSVSYDEYNGKVLITGKKGDTTFNLSLRSKNSGEKLLKFNTGYGIDGINILSAMSNQTDVSKMPCYGTKETLYFYVQGSGKLLETLNQSAFTIQIESNSDVELSANLETVKCLDSDSDKVQYMLGITLPSNVQVDVQESSYYTLNVKMEYQTTSVESSLNFRLIDATNIHSGDQLIGNRPTGNYVLNNNIVLTSSDVQEKEKIDSYGTNYYHLDSIPDCLITFSNNSVFNGNGYQINAENIGNNNSNYPDKTLIHNNNSEIVNLKIKLGKPNTYSPSDANFSNAAAGIKMSGKAVVKNCYFENGLRGVRVLSSGNLGGTIDNCRFVGAVVAIEIYAGANDPNQSVEITIKDTYVNPYLNGESVTGSGELEVGLGIMYYPGNGGDGMRFFHNINLSLENYKYYGWFSSDVVTKQVKQMIQGILDMGLFGDAASAILDFGKELDQLFNEGAGRYVYGDKFSPGIVIPTRLFGEAFWQKKLDVEIAKTFDISSYKNNSQENNNSSFQKTSKSKDVSIGFHPLVIAKAQVAFDFYFYKTDGKTEPDTNVIPEDFADIDYSNN